MTFRRCISQVYHEHTNRAAIDERREHAAAAAEGLAHRTHAQNDVQICLDTPNEDLIDAVFRKRLADGGSILAHVADYAVLLVRREEIWHVTCIEDAVYILDKPLVDDLRIREEEDNRLALDAGRRQ